MNLPFSQRMGIDPISEALQIQSMDERLRNGLWNAFFEHIWENISYRVSSTPLRRSVRYLDDWGRNLQYEITKNYFDDTVDNINYEYSSCLTSLKSYFLEEAEWQQIYNFIEFVCISNSIPSSYQDNYIEECNRVLEKQRSGYRIIDKLVTPITNEIEINALEEAVHSPYQYANQHLHAALAKLSDRESPDYQNSIKESISAVESICKTLAGGNTLGDALKQIEKKLPINGQLKSAFEKLYAYTNNEQDGIRHARMDDSTTSIDEAKFMLVACSAFVNYLTAKASVLND